MKANKVQVIEFLKKYAKWRRGDNAIAQPQPKEILEMLDFAIYYLEDKND